MKPERLLKHEFVEFIPDQLEDDTIYISIPYATVTHKCCCGCGTEVVTPLSPPTGHSLSTASQSLSTPRSGTGALTANPTIGYGATGFTGPNGGPRNESSTDDFTSGQPRKCTFTTCIGEEKR